PAPPPPSPSCLAPAGSSSRPPPKKRTAPRFACATPVCPAVLGGSDRALDARLWRYTAFARALCLDSVLRYSPPPCAPAVTQASRGSRCWLADDLAGGFQEVLHGFLGLVGVLDPVEADAVGLAAGDGGADVKRRRAGQ